MTSFYLYKAKLPGTEPFCIVLAPHFFLAFIKVPSSADLSNIDLRLTCSASIVSWLPDGVSEREESWLVA